MTVQNASLRRNKIMENVCVSRFLTLEPAQVCRLHVAAPVVDNLTEWQHRVFS